MTENPAPEDLSLSSSLAEERPGIVEAGACADSGDKERPMSHLRMSMLLLGAVLVHTVLYGKGGLLLVRLSPLSVPHMKRRRQRRRRKGTSNAI